MLSSSFTTALVICGAEVLEGGVNGGGVGPQLRTVIRLVLFFAVRILPKTLYHPWATVVHDASFPFSKRARSIKATAGSQRIILLRFWSF